MNLMAYRLLLREWRSGELRAVAAATVLAVCVLTATGLVTTGVEESLRSGATDILAADLRVTSRNGFDPHWSGGAENHALKSSRVITFPTVVLNGLDSTLASIKVVDTRYPLRGQLLIADQPKISGSPPSKAIAPGELWVESRILSLLNAKVGDKLSVGLLQLPITAVLVSEPDRGGNLFELSPRVMMHRADLDASGLLAEGSRARYDWLLSGTQSDLGRFEEWLKPQLGEARILTPENAQRNLKRAMDRARSFISLAAISAVMLAGIAIMIAAQRFSQRHQRSIALLRCLGATRWQALSIYLWLIMGLALGSALVGVSIGAGTYLLLSALLASFMDLNLVSANYVAIPGYFLAGVILLFSFALPGLAQLYNVPPIKVLNHSARSKTTWFSKLTYLLPLIALSGLVIGTAGATTLALGMLASLLLSLLVLLVLAQIALKVAKTLSRGVGVGWRFGMANLFRHPTTTLLQTSAIGLGLTLVLLLVVVRGELFDAWQRQIPAQSPNYFLINIQPNQAADFEYWLQENLPLEKHKLYPMATARIASINGKVVIADDYKDPVARSRVLGTVNLSRAAELPSGNKLLAGKWWQPNAPLEASLSASWAKTMGLSLGDNISFQVGEKSVSVKVSSLRDVEWGTLKPNFFILLRPDAFSALPHNLVTSIYLPPEQESLLADLVQKFPNINVLGIGQILKQVRRVLDLASLALNVIFLFTLLAGILVLFTVLLSGIKQRVREMAILKVLGATKRRIHLGSLAEFLVSGLLAGLVAGAASSGIAWWLGQGLFGLEYEPSASIWLISLGVSGLIVVLASRLAVRPALSVPPWQAINR